MKSCKYLLVGSLLLLLFSFQINAQYTVGLKVGHTAFTWENGTIFNGKIGVLNGVEKGVTLNVRLKERFSLQAEVTSLQKGSISEFEETEIGNGMIFKQTIRIKYLEIPMLIRYSSKEFFDRMSFFISAGASIGFENGTWSKTEGFIDGMSLFSTEGGANGYADSDFSFVTGAGLEFAIFSHILLSVNARYILGLININENNSDFLIKNRGLAISFGLLYRIKNNAATK